MGPMTLHVEFDREEDGRWIADVTELPGVMAYGSTKREALAAAQALALRVVAERIEHGEATDVRSVEFAEAPAA